MNVGFIGLGKLGLTCGLAIESKGHKVCGFDIDPNVENIIKTKKLPYQEEGAQELLDKSNLKFTDMEDVVKSSEIIFVPIQTPHERLYEGDTRIPDTRVDFNYTALKSGMKDLSDEIEKQGEDKVVIIISTVLPGTMEREIIPLLGPHVKVCYNPFFIAMGTTVEDFLFPEFILFGVDDTWAAKKAEAFYKTVNSAPFYKTSIINAELIKVGYNTYISMKICFANTLMEICHKNGANVDEVTDGIKLGSKRIISPMYFSGGMGDGGFCHPRDSIALSWLSRELDLSHNWFDDVMKTREDQTEWLAKLMEEYDLPKVILGKAFKAGIGLVGGSPSILLKNIMEERGHKVEMYDPHIDSTLPSFGPSVFLIGTKHPEFVNFKFPKGSVVIDPWRYIPEDIDGVKVIGIGR